VDPAAVAVVAAEVAAIVVVAKDAVVAVMEPIRRACTETVTVAASRAIGRMSVAANSPRRKKQPIRPKMRRKVLCSRNWRRLTRSLQGIAAASTSSVMGLVFRAV
jgi:D-aminopeptidase